MRANVDAFVEAGGNVALLSANTCWFQIRYGLNSEKQTCYKDARFDPYATPEPSLTTVNWYDRPVCKAETAVTGVSYYGPIEPSALYRVRTPGHWVFGGLDFDTHSFFGLYKDKDGIPRTVVGPETDKYQVSSDPCKPNSPQGFISLAVIPPLSDPGNVNAPPAGTMGIFAKGKGQVFTVGTINWSLGLSQTEGQSTEIDQITRTVLDELSK